MAYSDKVIEHYENPRNVGSFDKDDPSVGTGLVGAPACGDVMKLQLKISDEGIIQDAKFKRALKFVIDGFEPKTVVEILDTDSFHEFEEMEVAGKLVEGMGGFSPTIGIIGAVLGLIHVMRNLSNPDVIGPGIAIAFVATVYGVGFANLWFMPMGTKIKRKATILQMKNELIKVGVQGIQEGLNRREAGAVIVHAFAPRPGQGSRVAPAAGSAIRAAIEAQPGTRRYFGSSRTDVTSAPPSSTAATTSKPLSRSSRVRPSRRSARSSAITTRKASPP